MVDVGRGGDGGIPLSSHHIRKILKTYVEELIQDLSTAASDQRSWAERTGMPGDRRRQAVLERISKDIIDGLARSGLEAEGPALSAEDAADLFSDG